MRRRSFDRAIRAIRGGRVYVFEGRDPNRTNIVAVGDYQGEAILTETGIRRLIDALENRFDELTQNGGGTPDG